MTRTLADPAVRPPVADAGSRGPRMVPVLVVAVLLAATVRAFLVESYVVPSDTIVPTVQPGDRVLVLKTAAPTEGDLVVVTAPAGPEGIGGAELGDGATARVLGPVAEALGVRPHVGDEVSTVESVDGNRVVLAAPSARTITADDVVGTVVVRFWPLDRVGPVEAAP